jgi:hypothetical protein
MLNRGRVLAFALWAIAAPAADNALQPLTVCEVLEDLPAHDGKPVAVLGRFSFRRDGRSINQETCGDKPAPGEPPLPHSLSLADDAKTGPKPPEVFALDGATLERKMKLIRQHTSLRTFRFGTPDYDRWAVVYGRIEIDKSRPPADHPAPPTARLVYRGDGVILFLHEN